MTVKVEDLVFDCSKWDIDGSNFVGLTGIMFDGCVSGKNEKGEKIFSVEVENWLNQELAKVCETDLDTIEVDIYDI